jgi:putative membrane protein
VGSELLSGNFRRDSRHQMRADKTRSRGLLMNTKCLRIAVFAAAAVLVPAVVIAQVDPNGSPGSMPGPSTYPQSPQGMNQPVGAPGSTAPTGAQTSPATSMRDSLGAPGMTGQQMLDKQFLRAAAEGGMADVKLGMLAVQKGGPDVKELAQRMVDDHTSINRDMASVADSVGVMLPKKMGKDEEAEYDKLNGLSGKDFDAEYLSYMAKVHYQELHNFHMEASVASDPELQSEVVKAMMMMHEHLGMIAKLAKEQGITLPTRPARPAPGAVVKQ